MTIRKLNLTSLSSLAVLSIMLVSCGDDDAASTPNELPVALFTALPISGTVGDEITFTDQSGDSDGEIVSWAWDFDDGNTSSDQNPTHIYEQAGDYEVALTVTDDSDEMATFDLSVSIDAFAELWTATIGTAAISPSAPAVGADGTLYFGSQDFNVYAVDPSDGAVKWSYTTGGRVRSQGAIGSDGTIYIPSQDNNIYALSSAGSMLWSFETGGFFDASPALGSDGTIYVGADDAKLYALNSNGTEKWSFEAGARIRCDAIATSDAVYFASEDAKLYSLSLSGSENWSFETSARIVAHPALGSDGTIYVGDDAGEFYAINPNGTQKWKFSTADANPFNGGAAIGEDGTIYVGTKRGATTDMAIFYAINPDGSEKWKIEMPKGDEVEGSDQYYQNDILGTPTVGADGTIYTTYNDGQLYAINSDGSIKFTYKVAADLATERWDQAIWTSPALTDDGNLFFQDYSGNVYGLQVSASGMANSSWPTRGKNLRRTGF